MRLRLAGALLLLVALLLNRGELDGLVLGCRLLGGAAAVLGALWLLRASGGRARTVAIASFSLALVLAWALLFRALGASGAWALAGALPVALAVSTRLWLSALADTEQPPPQLLGQLAPLGWPPASALPALALLAAGAGALAVLPAVGAGGAEDTLPLSLLLLAAGLLTVAAITALSAAALLVALPLGLLLGEARSSVALARAGGFQALPGLLPSLLASAVVIAVGSPSRRQPRPQAPAAVDLRLPQTGRGRRRPRLRRLARRSAASPSLRPGAPPTTSALEQRRNRFGERRGFGSWRRKLRR